MSDLDSSIKAIRMGAIAAFVSAFLTTGLTLLAYFTSAEGVLGYFNDLYNLIDALIIALLGIGILRRSRVAAGLALIYYIMSQLIIRIDLVGEFDVNLNIGIILVFLGLYSGAFIGTLKYHSIMKAENPDTYSVSKKSKILGTGACVLMTVFIFLMVVGLVLPDNEHFIFSEDEILESDYELLFDLGLIAEHEELIYFFPHNPFDYTESGNFVTKDRVVLYVSDESEITYYEVLREQLTHIELETTDFLPSMNRYRVFTDDEEVWITLFLSTIQNHHKDLLAEIGG